MFLALTLVLAFCAGAHSGRCMRLAEQNHMYAYSLAGGKAKSVFFPLARVGTQGSLRDLGIIKLYNQQNRILELGVTVTIPSNPDEKSVLVVDEMHTEKGCGDETFNDCITNVPENQYPMWAICKEFEFTLEGGGLYLGMKLEGKFLVVSVKGELVGKIALPPIACHPNAIRNTITRIAYEADSTLVKPFICID